MADPPFFDDTFLESQLRLAGVEPDFTQEVCYQQLIHRLAEQAVPVSQRSIGAATGEAGKWEWMVGRHFGDFELQELIAQGGMGVVFKARHLKLNRMVAIKMIRSGDLASREEVQRFQLETEVAAGLDHPAIVPVYEAGCIQGQPFYSMGYVDGLSLARKLLDGPLESRQSASLLEVIAAAIQYAHERGVVHRDLKPSNVLLQSHQRYTRTELVASFTETDGNTSEYLYPKVTDFGLASLTHIESDLTTSGQLIGTPSYMAPEQAQGNVLDPKLSDIYSMGGILYAMLTGRPPFHSQSTLAKSLTATRSLPVT